MTPKEKAKELINLFTFKGHEYYNAKICAEITVNEIIQSKPLYPSDPEPALWDNMDAALVDYYQSQEEEALQYWQEVKEEIEKLL